MSELSQAPDSTQITQFRGNLTTYIKEHVLLAALGSVAASGVLIAMGNPHAWTGVVGAVAAIGARGIYVASEQLGFVWVLTDRKLILPDHREVLLSDIDKIRTIFSAVQVITRNGDKYLIKYQSDPAATKAAIEAHM